MPRSLLALQSTSTKYKDYKSILHGSPRLATTAGEQLHLRLYIKTNPAESVFACQERKFFKPTGHFEQ